jgi:hypothetical protein
MTKTQFDLTAETVDLRFAEAARTSAPVAMVADMIARGCNETQSLKVCILTLTSQIDELIHAREYLEDIAPKLYEMPDGRRYRFNVPDRFLHAVKPPPAIATPTPKTPAKND